jgi:hypothetical protein
MTIWTGSSVALKPERRLEENAQDRAACCLKHFSSEIYSKKKSKFPINHSFADVAHPV